MMLEVLDEAWLPPRLVGRQEQLRKLAALIAAGGVCAVVGQAGTGKTTLVRMVVRDAVGGVVWVDCGRRTSYSAIAAALAARHARVVVLDDFTLARRDAKLWSMVARLGREGSVVLTAHPSVRAELIAHGVTRIVDMPPYNAEELFVILLDRVIEGGLAVDDEALEVIARRVGWPEGPGSARIALRALRTALELAGGRAGREHAEAALELLSIAPPEGATNK